MKIFRFSVALAAAAMLSACGPDRPVSPGAAPPPVSIADKAVLESTRALILAELSYEAAATTALKLIQTRVIRGPAAGNVQRANTACTKALVAAKGATSVAQRLAAVSNLRSAISGLRTLLPGEAPDEVR
jgi:hypothetical protein